MASGKDDDERDEAKKRFGRRGLFLGVGAAAAAVPVLESCEPAKVAPAAGPGCSGRGAWPSPCA